MRKAIKIILIIVVVLFLGAAGFVLAVYYGAFGHLQSREELQNYKNATATIVLSRDGQLLGKFFSENRTNVTYEELPPHLVNALLATEDIRFFNHRGYDVKSFFRVLVKTVILRNKRAGGGSTLTQQLAKNMYGRNNYGRLTIYVNKVKEIILARRIEKSFSKQEILLLYLNTVSFGENVFGIEAAARRFFNKEVSDLEIEEAAVLIGILKANNYYNPRLYPENAKRRRNVVLGQMKKYEFLDTASADSLMALPLVPNYINFESKGPADYFLYQVKQDAAAILQSINTDTNRPWNLEEDGLVITTTLDYKLQTYANKAFAEHMTVMQERLNKQYATASGKRAAAAVAGREMARLGLTARASQPSLLDYGDSTFTGPVTVRDSMIRAVTILHAGLLAMDPVTGEVKAYVGGIDFQTQPYDQILARRQVASTFKPILYAAALEEGIEPCRYLDNDSITDSGIEGWSPRNFDHSYGGKYSFAGALINSMNVPTYNLYMSTDFNRLDSLWRLMGFSYDLNDYPSVPMGTAEANIKEMTIAYAAFANGGYRVFPKSIISIETADGEVLWKNEFQTPTESILSQTTTQLITAILRRAVTGGTARPLVGAWGVTLPFAGKTGTSQDYADAWFAAYNPSLVIVSRAGASSPSIHFNSGSNGSGSTLALPLVGRTLRSVQQDKELRKELISEFPELPEELARQLDCPDFREITLFQEIIDIFKGRDKPIRKEILKPGEPLEPDTAKVSSGKKKGIFRRLFQKKR